MIDQLSLHRFYDHKIKLNDEETFSRSRLYQMFNHKLQKIKKYLIDHLNKNSFSSALHHTSRSSCLLKRKMIVCISASITESSML